MNGAGWAPGKYASGVLFDGINDFISVPDSNSLHITGPGTLSAWIKLTALNRWHGLFAKGNVNDSGQGSNYGLEVTNANKLTCSIGKRYYCEHNNVGWHDCRKSTHLCDLPLGWGGDENLFKRDIRCHKFGDYYPGRDTTALLLGQYAGNVDPRWA